MKQGREMKGDGRSQTLLAGFYCLPGNAGVRAIYSRLRNVSILVEVV
jgi:hypothetical protein